MFPFYCFLCDVSINWRVVHQWVDSVSTRGQDDTKHSVPAAWGEITPHMLRCLSIVK